MVNHRHISVGESRLRVQLVSLSLGKIKQHLNHFPLLCGPQAAEIIALAKHLRGLLNILITHNDCFPKCCEVVTTLHQQLGQVKGLWFDTHIVIMTIFSQP